MMLLQKESRKVNVRKSYKRHIGDVCHGCFFQKTAPEVAQKMKSAGGFSLGQLELKPI